MGEKNIVILGAGLAGVSIAYHLDNKSLKVFEKSKTSRRTYFFREKIWFYLGRGASCLFYQ